MEKDYPQNIVQALTLVGLGVYAAIRFGQQLYCNKLQVTPEEVGLTYTASISRAAVILIAFLAPVIVAITLGLIYIVIRAPRVLDRLILLLTWTAVFVLLFLGGTALGMSGVTFMYVGAMVIGAGFIVGAAIVWSIGKLRQRYGTLFSYGVDGAGSQALYSRRFQLYYLVIIGSFVVLILFIAAFAGTEAARDVQGGRTVSLGRNLGVLGIQSSPVQLTGDTPTNPDLNTKRLMYLGRASGMIVLYDVDCGAPLRIPDDGVTIVVLKSLPDRMQSSCPDASSASNPTRP